MRNIFLPILLPSIGALVVLIALGTPGSALAAAMVTMAGFVMVIVASRDSFQRQLQALIRKTRGRIEGAPAVRSPDEGMRWTR
jgi:two-component system phosphate regulon sensor histidine kinase PhoR